MPTVITQTRAGSLTFNRTRSAVTQTAGSKLTFEFPFTPVEVGFDQIGSEYAEIARPGDYALIDRRSPNLLRASFQFRVANRASAGLASIEDELRILRRIATEDSPVSFTGIPGFLTNDDPSLTGATSTMLFRIVDLSITIVRVSPSNEPTQVDARITVSEDRNPTTTVVTLPRISYEETPAIVSTNAGKKKRKNTGGATPADTPPTPAVGYSQGSQYASKFESTEYVSRQKPKRTNLR